ncbi:FCD domain-containing protein [Pollutimonas bauzanensis]|uniref:Transcriptional regulator, GntR family n=1 Tax=Pollutimonas bauzanensis TaxID=658167 RepID=A0A1M5ZYV7_9BURK|nr:FCD domain-containing protein [Pollutimonas bauzanensis]SHI29229.1 transcriptional regulator, GntR family [Pollutimonas bauzanensis]
MNESVAIAATDAREPKTLVEGAYNRLRRDIIEGVHRPGEKLRVEHLKDQYDVGAGTLREALLLLIADALVVAQGQRGFRVTPISLADFEDITRSRLLIECEALKQSIACGDEAWEANLVAAFHRLSIVEQKLAANDTRNTEEWEKRNRIFHDMLIAACPSRWILRFQQVLYQQSERYRRLSMLRRPISRDVHAEHQALFQATLDRDTVRAVSILSEHILRTLDAVKHMDVDFFKEHSNHRSSADNNARPE